MCTLIVSFTTAGPVPVLLVGVRDEYHDRLADPPAAHWPDRPGLVGGRDRLAGGTWLAVDPAARRAGCVLNGRGRPAPVEGRRSRGELPLAAAAGEAPPPSGELPRFDPFHLVTAAPSGVTVTSWDGTALATTTLEPGLHVVVNTGLDPGEPRARHFAPMFAAHRPEPRPGAPVDQAWAQWFALVHGAGLATDDPRAMIVDFPAGAGRRFGTTSVTLVALGPDAVRYDFSGTPGDPSGWTEVRTG